MERLCAEIGIPIENIRFETHDNVLHQAIKMNNEPLTRELIQHRYDVNAIGELGSPLVTAIHFDIYWAIELLLKHGADLTQRHIDWPYWTLYQYCIQFEKIKSKSIIQKHLKTLIYQEKYEIIDTLCRSGWKIYWTKHCNRRNHLRIA